VPYFVVTASPSFCDDDMVGFKGILLTYEPNRVSLCAQTAFQALKHQSRLLYLKSLK
jgi:hypothetical protein